MIPARTSIILSPYITQRNPRYFDDPEEFRPDRWRTIDPPKFHGFHSGEEPKMCIGDSFAMLEGVLVLATLARRWSLRCDDQGTVGIQPGITLVRSQMIRMRAVARVK